MLLFNELIKARYYDEAKEEEKEEKDKNRIRNEI